MGKLGQQAGQRGDKGERGEKAHSVTLSSSNDHDTLMK